MRALNQKQSFELLSRAIIEQAICDLSEYKDYIKRDARFFFRGRQFELYAAIADLNTDIIRGKIGIKSPFS